MDEQGLEHAVRRNGMLSGGVPWIRGDPAQAVHAGPECREGIRIAGFPCVRYEIAELCITAYTGGPPSEGIRKTKEVNEFPACFLKDSLRTRMFRRGAGTTVWMKWPNLQIDIPHVIE